MLILAEMMERKMREKQALHLREERLNSIPPLSIPPGKQPALTQSFLTLKAVHRAN